MFVTVAPVSSEGQPSGRDVAVVVAAVATFGLLLVLSGLVVVFVVRRVHCGRQGGRRWLGNGKSTLAVLQVSFIDSPQWKEKRETLRKTGCMIIHHTITAAGSQSMNSQKPQRQCTTFPAQRKTITTRFSILSTWRPILPTWRQTRAFSLSGKTS